MLLDISLDGLHDSEIADQLLQMKMPFASLATAITLKRSTLHLLHKPFTTGELSELFEKLVAPAREELAELYGKSVPVQMLGFY